MNFAPLLLGIPLRVQPVQNSELLPAESERVWSAGKGMNCAHCERVAAQSSSGPAVRFAR